MFCLFLFNISIHVDFVSSSGKLRFVNCIGKSNTLSSCNFSGFEVSDNCFPGSLGLNCQYRWESMTNKKQLEKNLPADMQCLLGKTQLLCFENWNPSEGIHETPQPELMYSEQWPLFSNKSQENKKIALILQCAFKNFCLFWFWSWSRGLKVLHLAGTLNWIWKPVGLQCATPACVDLLDRIFKFGTRGGRGTQAK